MMKLAPSKFADAEELSIGIISDTHGLLRPEATEVLEGCDVILHGGDVGREQILDDLEQIASVFTVRGNVDVDLWCGRLPNTLTLHLGELSIYMIHDLGYLDPLSLEGIDLVVYGHSHRPDIATRGETTFLNPGSAGPRRFSLPVTLARLSWKLGMKKIEPELIQLPV